MGFAEPIFAVSLEPGRFPNGWGIKLEAQGFVPARPKPPAQGDFLNTTEHAYPEDKPQDAKSGQPLDGSLHDGEAPSTGKLGDRGTAAPDVDRQGSLIPSAGRVDQTGSKNPGGASKQSRFEPALGPAPTLATAWRPCPQRGDGQQPRISTRQRAKRLAPLATLEGIDSAQAAHNPRHLTFETHLRTETAFPRDEHMVPLLAQPSNIARIAPAVRLDFFPPECTGLGGDPFQLADVAMPKAAVHQDDAAVAAQHQVGPTGESPHMESVPEANLMQPFTQYQLRVSIFAANGRHARTTRFRG